MAVPVLPSEVVSAAVGDVDLVADIWSTDARMAKEFAVQAATVAELARRRGVGGARAAGRVGAVAPAEEFVAELAVVRGCTEPEAARLLAQSLLLTGALAAVWSELFTGALSVRKAQILIDLLGDASGEVAAGVLARVLPAAADCTPDRLADRARYHLYRLDAAARDRRRRRAEARADVHVERTPEGLGRLVIDGPLPQVHAARDAVDQYARWLRADGDRTPIGRLRAQVALDLVLRPWDTRRPPVTAQLTVHAAVPGLRPDGVAPGELDGQVITAAQCRQVLTDLDVLDLQPPPAGGSILIALDDPATGQTIAVATRAELARAAGTGRRRTRRDPLNRRTGAQPHPATHSATGTRTADRDWAGSPPDDPPPDGPGLRPPPPTGAYRPTAAHRRLVHARDRRCRMPGCRRRPGRQDLDHVTPHVAGGATACHNLCCLCRRHHRIKTHAPGWTFTLHPDATLTVTTPAGATRTTRPPGWCHDPEPDPPWLDQTAPPDPTDA
ncbi:HNH endonuclease signature motif containing protein [Blastococcus sp. SYSU D00695]